MRGDPWEGPSSLADSFECVTPLPAPPHPHLLHTLRWNCFTRPPKHTTTGEMSDAGETLLAMFEMIREASPAAAHALDRLFGLHVREAVHCTELHCRKVTHQNAYVQYFYNTRVRGRVVLRAQLTCRCAMCRHAVCYQGEVLGLGRLVWQQIPVASVQTPNPKPHRPRRCAGQWRRR